MIPEVPVGALMTPQTFSSYLRSQSTAIRGILGHGLDKYSDTALTTFATSLSSCEGISIFGDRSVKDGRGAHATQIYASSTFLLKTSAVTSGDPSTITYLRGETSSKLSGLYILFLIQTHFFNIPLTAPVTFYYDNKESLQCIDTLHLFSSYADPMTTDFDIWAESKRIKDLLHLELFTEHVPAHQDDSIAYEDLDRTAQINVDMDRAAETMRISEAPPTPIPIFESNTIAVAINNAIVTDNLGS